MHFSMPSLSSFPKELAYLDPGSGSILLQLILATILAIGVFVRSQWGRIKRFFGKGSSRVDDDDQE